MVRELSLSTGDCGSGFLQDLTFGADPDIKECRLLVFAKSIHNNDQRCALLALLFSADVLGDGMAFNVAA